MINGTRVVLVAFDGFPLHTFSPELTPNLWRLSASGGRAPQGGRSGLPSTTYPGFVCLLTGCSRTVSGVRTTSRKRDAVPGWAGSDVSLVPTVLHEAHDAGLRTAAVFGDHKLQRVARLEDAEWAWPPQAEIPAELSLDAHGYPVNAEVIPHLLAAAADPEISLLFGHLNETDTIGHDLGPDASETVECVRAADRWVGVLMEVLEPEWHRTIVIATSDHDMEACLEADPIDLSPAMGARTICDWIADGSAALARLAIGVDHDRAIESLRRLDGIAGWRSYEPDMLLLLASPGRVFAGQRTYAGGTHGNRSTSRTLAVVGGGHPLAPVIGESIAVSPPRLRDWAPTIAAIMGIDLPASDGDPLIDPRVAALR
jgi:hypothetical protein